MGGVMRLSFQQLFTCASQLFCPHNKLGIPDCITVICFCFKISNAKIASWGTFQIR